MTIFLITPLENNADKLGLAINNQFQKLPHDVFPLSNNAGWLVSWSGTAIELSNYVGITKFPPSVVATADQGPLNQIPMPMSMAQQIQDALPNPLGTALVTSVSSYYGVAQVSVWDWMKSRMEGR
jgi:hypothetical protein